MGKTALVVDDSRTARKVLQRMLEVHDLVVDHAASAEDALNYLGQNRPEIIFMDHEMPGMDGFEAVTAIKKNPATATIPIMMYTAQEGELYVGQARALGAVGVLPKQVEPVELSKVLESLRVIGEDAERREHYLEVDEDRASGEYPALDRFDQDLGVLIQELFDQQRAIMRRDLRNSQEEIAARVADEIRTPAKDPGRSSEGWLMRHAPTFAAALLAVFVALFAWLYWLTLHDSAALRQQNADLQIALEQQHAAGSQDSFQAQQQLAEYRQTLDSTYAVALDALEWAANRSPWFDFYNEPLGDVRLTIVDELSSRLNALNFRGLVRIESNVGDFCMTMTGPAEYVLAAPDLPAARCDRIGFDVSEAYERGLRQSAAFSNFISRANERSGGAIRFEIISLGNTNPLAAYPSQTDVTTASTWNQIAASNQRVDILLFPDISEGTR
jgi:CheY-like chemotaxis protein